MRLCTALFAGLSGLVTGCGSCADSSDSHPTADIALTEHPPEVVRILDELPMCDIDHRGLVIDFGGKGTVGRLAWGLDASETLSSVEHDGADWTELRERSVDLAFRLTEPAEVFIAARLRGHTTRSAVATIDGVSLGALRFSKEEVREARTSTTSLPLAAGPHVATIRLIGAGRATEQPFAELDWVRIGTPNKAEETEATFGAPTLRDVRRERAAIAGVPHEALALRAPSAVRCSLRVPANGRLQTALGMQGVGEAAAEVRVLREDHEPVSLHRSLVTSEKGATWKDLDLDLASFAGQLVEIELASDSGTESGRLLFGDPVVISGRSETPAADVARAVIVVVLSGVTRSGLPPWSRDPTPHLPALAELARQSVTFDEHRAPSSLVSASMASLLTGQLPMQHGLGDSGARLPDAAVTIAENAQAASITTGMFTAVPSTFPAFGFEQGWQKFVMQSPSSGEMSTAPIEDAGQWIVSSFEAKPDGRLFAVIHARGGHPPWPVSDEVLSELPPENYTGDIRPRTAAQRLARERSRRKPYLGPGDRERAYALYAYNLSRQDAALAKLIDQLERAGVWDDTLFVVTGDVSSAIPTFFADPAELEEEVLQLPLYVRFPKGKLSGERVSRPTEAMNVTATAYAALGVVAPKTLHNESLYVLALGAGQSEDALHIATYGDKYSARWGNWALHGEYDRAPKLCALDVDPTCAFDRSDVAPLTTQAMYRRMARDYRTLSLPSEQREPVTIDADMAAILNVWGAGE